MAKRKVLFKWFTIADYLEEEIWLSQQQQKGWKLVDIKPIGIFVFEETTETQAIYKLDFKNQNPAEDYIQMYRDYGWEYVTKCYGWNYFRSIEGAQVGAEELDIFSDDASKLEMIQEVFQKRILPIVAIFLSVILPNLFRKINVSSGIASFIINFYVILAIVYVILLGYTGWKLLKLKRSLTNRIRN